MNFRVWMRQNSQLTNFSWGFLGTQLMLSHPGWFKPCGCSRAGIWARVRISPAPWKGFAAHLCFYTELCWFMSILAVLTWATASGDAQSWFFHGKPGSQQHRLCLVPATALLRWQAQSSGLQTPAQSGVWWQPLRMGLKSLSLGAAKYSESIFSVCSLLLTGEV